MSSSNELYRGIPRSILEPNDDTNALQTVYGNFAFSVLLELNTTVTNFPEDIAIIGDNWFQLVTSRNDPQNPVEVRVLRSNPDAFFADLWQIMERRTGETISDYFREFEVGIRAGSLRKRIRYQIAVIDRTSMVNPLYDEENIDVLSQESWGRVVQVRGTKARVFHITHGFTPKIVQNVIGSPGDDFSSAIYVDDHGDS